MILAIVKFNINKDSAVKTWKFSDIPNDWYFDGNEVLIKGGDEYRYSEFFVPKHQDIDDSVMKTFLEEFYGNLKIQKIITNYVIQINYSDS